ncbi:MAG: hypothetical protein DRP74_01115 [Candidatus Omnitrophota bacterium]|nr:MAG: hypothetical protein DRP74_01115 [Candidatus Omnitrophota bacterium]
MREDSKNKLILILLILVIIFFISTVASCGQANRQRISREKELSLRLDMEEKINKALQEKRTAEEELARLRKELEEERSAHQSLKDSLGQEDLAAENQEENPKQIIEIKEEAEEN